MFRLSFLINERHYIFTGFRKPAAMSSCFVVAAIDFGTTFSGGAYSFKTSPNDVAVHNWERDQLTSLKTPTTLLLKRVENGKSHSPGLL